MLVIRKFYIGLTVYLLTTVFLLCSCSSKETNKKEESKIVTENSSYINFRNELKNRKVAIYDNFDNNITSIVVTDFCMNTKHKTYTFDNTEKISDFVSILSGTYWSEPSDNWDITKEFTDMRFELKSGEETTTTINTLAWVVDCYAVVEIVSNGKSEIFEISESAYLNMRAFATKRYYLHKSSIEPPTKSTSLKIKNRILYNLDDDEKEYVSDKLRNVHYTLELLLIENVSFLKEPDSTCWEMAITGHAQNVEKGVFSFNGVMENIQAITVAIKDKKAKKVFEECYKELKRACDNRNVEKIFKVHEVIHDYDYYAINYPAHYDLQPADWGGIGIYFGHLRSE